MIKFKNSNWDKTKIIKCDVTKKNTYCDISLTIKEKNNYENEEEKKLG